MRRLVPVLPVLILVLSTSAYGQDIRRDVAKCAALVGDLDRLECFDEMAVSHELDGPVPQPVTAAGTGKWLVSRDKNPVDDSERVVILLTADTGRSRWGDQVTFVARCQSNKTEAYINWNDYVGDDSSSVYQEWKYVTIRIGKNDAVRQQWSTSTDKKATFAPDWPGDLLKQMANDISFLAQTTPYGESPVLAIFDTTGMSAALQPLADTCGWALN